MRQPIGFDTVLVANRGEIARRIMRTLRRLGIRSVAVYSDADAGAPHVREADLAVRIGPADAARSYLDIAAVIAAAHETGAQAIHPGYGFLSENAAFARACADAGILFIGPGERALEVMGDKIRAKEQVAASGVPTVPGFSAAGLDDDAIAARAAEIGLPLLVKPSAGGGGKGMQIVRSLDALAGALAAARRVATAAFGDDTLLLERLIERPRHIEVQVLADAHGHVIHLGERECTLQRRHQKVVEEAPSPIVDAAMRARLGAAACASAESVDYVGVGTVEFLVPGDRPDECWFIEMNTRLQVEHPVTELVTGIDLVEQQLRVAAGERLAIGQDDVRLSGHAIEARVYAESPERGFLPATGDVLRWRAASTPAGGVRTDAGVETGSTVTADYDPLVAKVIAHADDRAAAVARLDAALADTVLLGVDTNLAFLRSLLADPAVRAGDLDTGLIDRLPAPTLVPPTPAALHAAAAASAAARNQVPSEKPALNMFLTYDVVSRRASALWRSGSGWRAGGPAVPVRVLLRDDAGGIHPVEVPGVGESGPVEVAQVAVSSGSRGPDATPEAVSRGSGLVEVAQVAVSPGSRGPVATPEAVSGAPAPSDEVADGAAAHEPETAIDGDGAVWVHAGGHTHRLRPVTRRAAMAERLASRAPGATTASPQLRAPMPGTVVAVHVADGEPVASGARLVTIEAMKMEHSVTAPHDGAARVHAVVGAQVRRDELLAEVIPRESDHD